MENLLHFNLADFPVALIFYAGKLVMMGNSKNSRVFNFAILLKLRKLQKFGARKIYMFYIFILFWRFTCLCYLWYTVCLCECGYKCLNVNNAYKCNNGRPA